jgi:hypothetical protein
MTSLPGKTMLTAYECRIIRLTLALLWLISGLLSAGLYPREDSLELIAGLGLPNDLNLLLLYGGAALDLLLGALTLFWPSRRLWLCQIAVVLLYTLLGTVAAPEYWLHPFAPFVKNLSVLVLLWLLARQDRVEGL